jgi:glycosyltransferase involved in cell wall biosynthesis
LAVSFVGRLVPFKALPLLLDAMARLRGEGRAVVLTVAGDGPMAQPWRAHARELGLDGAVRWLGAVPLDQVPAVMQDSHVFCLPSVRESGGAVLLEAMACARPVIGLDFGGPAEVIDDAVGWKLAATDAATVVEGLTQVLRHCHDHPDDAAERGQRGAARVRAEHTWPARIARALRLYETVLPAAPSPSLPVTAATTPVRSLP